MIVQTENPSFNEQPSHIWIKYDGVWCRFTLKQIIDAKEMANSNKHETPTIIQRIEYFFTNLIAG